MMSEYEAKILKDKLEKMGLSLAISENDNKKVVYMIYDVEKYEIVAVTFHGKWLIRSIISRLGTDAFALITLLDRLNRGYEIE